MIREVKKTDCLNLVGIGESDCWAHTIFWRKKIFCTTESIFLFIFSMFSYMDLNKTVVGLDL